MPEFKSKGSERRSENGRVLIAAGGTGGHVFPGLAVAEQLKKQGVGIIWVGTASGIEARVVTANDIPVQFINVVGLRGKSLVFWLKAPFLMLSAILAVMQIIRQYQVAVVLGMGGYVSVAAGVAAIVMRKPLVLQEQNAIPGSANKFLSPFARRIFTGFDGVFPARKSAQWSGNPLRATFVENIDRDTVVDPNHVRILGVGGSLGAHALNVTVPEAIARLSGAALPLSAVQVVHQTGQADVEQVRQDYRKHGVKADVHAFIEDMSAAYRVADIVIARAGALTVSEICAVGVAAIFIPYPYAIDDHQTANASTLVRAGAARLISQQDLCAVALADELSSLLANRSALAEMGSRARSLACLDAASVVASACGSLMHD